MQTNFEDFKKRMLSDKDVSQAYEEYRAEFEVAQSLIRARVKAKMTQKEVAEKMHTSQAAIARYESGRYMPSLKTILKYANAVKQSINLKILPH